MLPVVARLRLPDGRELDVHSETDSVVGTWYYWTEGNNGCDCNRSLYLGREYGLDFGGPDECLPCGDTIVLVSLTVDGKPLDGTEETII